MADDPAPDHRIDSRQWDIEYLLREIDMARKAPGRVALLLANIEKVAPEFKEYDFSPIYAEIAQGYLDQSDGLNPAHERARELRKLSQHYREKAMYSTNGSTTEAKAEGMSALERIFEAIGGARENPAQAELMLSNIRDLYPDVKAFDLCAFHSEIAAGYLQRMAQSGNNVEQAMHYREKAMEHQELAEYGAKRAEGRDGKTA